MGLLKHLVRIFTILGIAVAVIAFCVSASSYFDARVEQARAIGHAEGFVQGLIIGTQINPKAPAPKTN